MLLSRLVLRDFRRFNRYEIRLSPGLNVIVGDNEAGKSTIREALTTALFENPRTTDRKVLGQTRWQSGEKFAIELDFTSADTEYHLEKDFEGRTVRLTNLNTGETIVNVSRVESLLKEFVGVESRRLFESTLRFSQRDITSIQDGTTIADRLQQAVTGGADDVRASEVLGKLDAAARKLKSTSRANPGPLVALPETIRATRLTLDARREALRMAEATRETLQASRTEHALKTTDLEEKQRLRRICDLRLKVEEQLTAAAGEASRLTTLVTAAQKLDDRLRAADNRLRELTRFRSISRDELDRIAALELQATDSAGDSADSPSPAESLAREDGKTVGQGGRSDPEPGDLWSANTPLVSAAPRQSDSPKLVWVGAAITAVGIACAFLIPSLSAPSLAVAIVGLGLAAWIWSRSQRANTETAADRDAAYRGHAERVAARMVAQQQHETANVARRAIAELLDRHAVSSLGELRASCLEVERVERERAQAQAQIDGMTGASSLRDLDDTRRSASMEARDLRARLDEPEMLLARIDLADYTRLGTEIDTLRKRTEDLDRQIVALQTRIEIDSVSAADVHSIEEELNELVTALSAAEEKQRVFALARDVLAEARQATLVTARNQLESRLGNLVADLTGGRYSSLTVSSTNLDISLQSPERAEPIAVALGGDLSQGTVEQIYLAARIALVELLTGDRWPPLILDDPFVSFDHTRTAAALELCKRLAAERQIILFTKDPASERHADHVVLLPAVGAS